MIDVSLEPTESSDWPKSSWDFPHFKGEDGGPPPDDHPDWPRFLQSIFYQGTLEEFKQTPTYRLARRPLALIQDGKLTRATTAFRGFSSVRGLRPDMNMGTGQPVKMTFNRGQAEELVPPQGAIAAVVLKPGTPVRELEDGFLEVDGVFHVSRIFREGGRTVVAMELL